jgi:hypothetical protein
MYTDHLLTDQSSGQLVTARAGFAEVAALFGSFRGLRGCVCAKYARRAPRELRNAAVCGVSHELLIT